MTQKDKAILESIISKLKDCMTLQTDLEESYPEVYLALLTAWGITRGKLGDQAGYTLLAEKADEQELPI